jgi:copper chaperone
MLTFHVDDIHCGHCVRAIKDALYKLDSAAAVDVDLNRRVVKVQSREIDERQVRSALIEAGYSPRAATTAHCTTTVSAERCGCASARCGCGHQEAA